MSLGQRLVGTLSLLQLAPVLFTLLSHPLGMLLHLNLLLLVLNLKSSLLLLHSKHLSLHQLLLLWSHERHHLLVLYELLLLLLLKLLLHLLLLLHHDLLLSQWLLRPVDTFGWLFGFLGGGIRGLIVERVERIENARGNFFGLG